ncbi:isoleucine--tRNA ligase [Patescibacteria group bacterium]|nr:isoleucine--tRNA ligase [Patescibacteria group bacterium]
MINFAEEEKKILDFWVKDKTFAKSLDKKSPKGEYTFYDGPPFATGTPHYGHIVASVMKDAVPRYQTMRGYHVDRKWGWDCHGLPVENIVEKDLKLKSKDEIDALGVDKFNSECRRSVLKYADEWYKFIPRIGRWVDMDHDYKTMDVSYMESIWWVFKQLFDKSLIYEGYKSMHICPRCQTTLSNFEVTQNYKDIKDLSVIAKFELVDDKDTYLLAWTTTPWTLPGNVALALSDGINYVKVKSEDGSYILAKDNVEKIFEGKKFEILEELDVNDLIGKEYKPLFDYYKDSDLDNKENIYRIQSSDFVTAEDGTGIVHIAPAFGEDDLNLGQEKDLPFIQHVDTSGKFKAEIIDWVGKQVKPKDNHQEADIEIIKNLAVKKLLFSKEKYEHSYPHCWRCDTPLLNYATSSWFVKVREIKDKMLKNNSQINWQPEHIKDGRFGKWLDGARDWAISRQRYWGAGLPIWKNESGEVICIGSIEELEKLSGLKIEDLHRPYIDDISWEDSKGKWQRIPDVLDCWFESGSMPYAQVHYPFENKKEFEKNFPAQFIAEGQDQTRGWFYTLIVLSTALFDKPAFKNVIVNGIVLAEDGNKMSKRLKNYPDPTELIDKYGADSLRYYLLTSPVMKATDLRFVEKDVAELYRNLVMTTINIVNFYNMYVGNANIKDKENVLDEWLNVRTQQLVASVTDNMEKYKLVEAARPILEYVNDFSTWYIRRSRDRFKDGSVSAIETTKRALEELAKVMAPFTPFLAEWIWKEIGYTNSVHLEDWSGADELSAKEDSIIIKMNEVRKVVEKAHAARDEASMKVRQPLASLSIKSNISEDYFTILEEEVNVKKIIIDESLKSDVVLDTKLTPELEQEGLLRDIVRQINYLRKKSGLTIEDRVNLLYLSDDNLVKDVFNKFSDELSKQVLADSIKEGEDKGIVSEELKVGNTKVKISLTK